MTESQSQELGRLLARARVERGLSMRELAMHVGMADGWIAGVEAGRFAEPAPDRVARIADALDIEPARIARITRGAVANGLPSMRTYFRTKFDLDAEQIAKVERYVERLRKDQK